MKHGWIHTTQTATNENRISSVSIWFDGFAILFCRLEHNALLCFQYFARHFFFFALLSIVSISPFYVVLLLFRCLPLLSLRLPASFSVVIVGCVCQTNSGSPLYVCLLFYLFLKNGRKMYMRELSIPFGVHIHNHFFFLHSESFSFIIFRLRMFFTFYAIVTHCC